MAAFLLLFLVVFPGVGGFAYATTLSIENSSSPPGTTGTAFIINASHTVVFDNINLSTVGFLDVEFLVTGSTGSDAFAFTGDFTNNTGVSWTDFHFQLGTGVGNDFAPFTTVGIAAFANPPPLPTSSVFTTLDEEAFSISWSGGFVPDGGVVDFTFPFLASGQVDKTFTLRDFPTVAAVPEPATMLLLGSGLIGLVGYGRKKFFKK